MRVKQTEWANNDGGFESRFRVHASRVWAEVRHLDSGAQSRFEVDDDRGTIAMWPLFDSPKHEERRQDALSKALADCRELAL